MPRPRPLTPQGFMRRYNRTTAHIVAESLGYATPAAAARIGLDGLHNRENYCEWLIHSYGGDACRCLQDSIRNRHYHKGYMAEYKLAKKVVGQAIEKGDEPLLASWF